MTTRLEKTLKREIVVDGRAFVVAVSPEGLKLTLKGKRTGQELRWSDLVSGDAALAAALNASVGRFESTAKSAPAPAAARTAPPPKKRATPTERSRGDARARRRSDGPSRSKRR